MELLKALLNADMLVGAGADCNAENGFEAPSPPPPKGLEAGLLAALRPENDESEEPPCAGAAVRLLNPPAPLNPANKQR